MASEWLHGFRVVAWLQSGCMASEWLHGFGVVAWLRSSCIAANIAKL